MAKDVSLSILSDNLTEKRKIVSEKDIKVLKDKRTELSKQIIGIDHAIVMLDSSPVIGESIKRVPVLKKGGLKDKIIKALNVINKGNVNEIYNEIARHENISNAQKFKRAITMLASQMKAKGILKADKDGLRNIYSLVK